MWSIFGTQIELWKIIGRYFTLCRNFKGNLNRSTAHINYSYWWSTFSIRIYLNGRLFHIRTDCKYLETIQYIICWYPSINTFFFPTYDIDMVIRKYKIGDFGYIGSKFGKNGILISFRNHSHSSCGKHIQNGFRMAIRRNVLLSYSKKGSYIIYNRFRSIS